MNLLRTKLKILQAVCLFLLGFIVSAIAIHLIVGDPLNLYGPTRSEKLALLKDWEGRAYSAAFGSSRVHNGFDPRIFDKALKGTPLESITLNMGVEGGSQTESYLMAERFIKGLTAPPPKSAQACLVLLEINEGANIQARYMYLPRSINIYNFDTINLAIDLSRGAIGRIRSAGRVGYALFSGVLHYANMGMLSGKIFHPPLSEEMLKKQSANDRRGMLSHQQTDGARKTIEAVLRNVPVKPSINNAALTVGEYSLLTSIQRQSPVHPIQFVYVATPQLADLHERPEYPPSMAGPNGLVPIINLAQPEKFPQLYEPKLWHDSGHLNEQGAQLMTSLLAKEMLEWFSAHPMTSRCGG